MTGLIHPIPISLKPLFDVYIEMRGLKPEGNTMSTDDYTASTLPVTQISWCCTNSAEHRTCSSHAAQVSTGDFGIHTLLNWIKHSGIL